MKALVISGGGSKGAFAGGVAEYLIDDCCHQYDLFVGCSTGSLLLSHLAIGKIDKIKKVYTSVSQNDIFSINPFKIKKTKTGYKTSIHHFNTIRTFIKGCPTFGESDNLRKLIRNSISHEDFNTIKEHNKKVIFTVSNLTLDTIEYFNSDDCNYEDYCDWAWASCNFTPFMSILDKNNYQYADGGFGSYVPILCAIENGACEIDVIILENENSSTKYPRITNPFSLLFRTFKFMNHQNSTKDIIIGKLIGLNRKVNINFYYTPYQLTENPLIFDAEEMTQWWKDGYAFAKSKNPVSFCLIPNSND
ncbi:putative patatin/cPLA2 family phospholipase [Mariniflexile fucanivorans]|uniref:Putative patatin/cPLA2 family phospholipase n=1 Tax=Mariniflexile fucanivorans TaxID=264023 RepID=A0A4R1RIA0_9FLAO|nr:patatin-like phospholipase family protein [Mariniflexile fucanivorans]TCL65676.1 putative patatin/cPLA2 family phospholipase [Mariniflexile fucanivorans]